MPEGQCLVFMFSVWDLLTVINLLLFLVGKG